MEYGRQIYTYIFDPFDRCHDITWKRTLAHNIMLIITYAAPPSDIMAIIITSAYEKKIKQTNQFQTGQTGFEVKSISNDDSHVPFRDNQRAIKN